jgi:glycosyltransferase involved in cell wall biosynthesis
MDAFVALSRAIRDIYVENGFDADSIECIPNMLDPAFKIPDGAETEGIQLLYVGSLTENKGVRYLIQAVSLLPEQYRLRIVGKGNRMANLQARARRCGVANRTTFSGQIPYEQIGEAYADADLFVHPGIWPEPLNRTVLEAMQASLPVVCTDLGGPPEVIPDDELLCEPENPEALAATIQRVEDISAGFGDRNQRRVLDHHSPSVVVPQIASLYKQLASQ